MTKLSLSFFGPFQVTLGQTAVTTFESDKVRALLAFLAVEANQAHYRSILANLLWPDQAEKRARTNLRHVLLKLRHAVSDHTAEPPFLLISRTAVQFNQASDHWLDTAAFSEHLATTIVHPHPQLESCQSCIDQLQQAAALYEGEFLSGFYMGDSTVFEEWLFLKREQFHRQAVDALHHLASYHERGSDFKQATFYAQRQIELEPWREEAHQQLMRLLALNGQRTAALVQFDTCQRILGEELGVEPASETVALYEQIKAGQLEPSEASARSTAVVSSPSPAAHDWGEAPDVTLFYGREEEQSQLKRWLIDGRCRLVAVLGMGGMGKTTLAAVTAKEVADQFDYVFWRSLLNAPPLTDIVHACLQFLSSFQLVDLPDSFNERLTLLFEQLRNHRCLLILDNVETILRPGDRAGSYRAGYEAFGQFFQRIGETNHQSCLLLTSRERPKGLSRLEVDSSLVRALQLEGLEAQAGQALLLGVGLDGSAELTAELLQRHSGNPLALKLISRTIQELFNHDIAAFLNEESAIFDDIRDVLDQQFGRLSPLEREIVIWLAIEREAVTAQTLIVNLCHLDSKRAFLEALRNLQRRSLLEVHQPHDQLSAATGVRFTLQNVVIEYITDYLIDHVCQEIEALPSQVGLSSELKVNFNSSLLNQHALLMARAKEYVRDSQRRLILAPVAERLLRNLGRDGLVKRLQHGLKILQATSTLTPGYAAANVLHLLLQLGVEVEGYDFSRLAVWQAYLRGVTLPHLDFSGSDLKGTVFTDAFGLVGAVNFSPDGNLLAAGTAKGEIRLWHTADGQPYAILKGHTNSVWSVAFSPDGQTLASGSEDQTIRLWAVASGQLLTTLHGHTSTVRSVAFSPDGKLLASGSFDQTICLWHAAEPMTMVGSQPEAVLEGHSNLIWSVAFSPDSQTLASGSDDQTVRLWDVRQGQLLATLTGHTATVRSVAFSPDGRTLASASDDQSIRLWSVANPDVTTTVQGCQTIHGHANYVMSLAFSLDGRTLASSSADQTIMLWHIENGRALKTSQTRQVLLGHTSMIWSVAFSPNSQLLASGSGDQSVRLWDAVRGTTHHILHGHSSRGNAVSFSPNGRLLASGGSDRMIRLWRVDPTGTEEGELLKTLAGHDNWVWSVSFSPDGRTLASASADQTIRLWDVSTGQLRHTLIGHTDRVRAVAFSPDGRTLASASDDHIIYLWDIVSGERRHQLRGHSDWVWSLAYSADGRTLASGSHDQTVCLWDASDEASLKAGQPSHILRGHTNRIWGIAFSPNGRFIASGSDDQTVRLWEIGKDVMESNPRVLIGHSKEIWSVAFSPNSQLLASGSGDCTIRLWDIDSGREAATLAGHNNWVLSVAFDASGQTLASTSVDETIKIWEVQTGKCRQTLHSPGPYVGMNINGVSGVSDAQKAALMALGAVAKDA